jgi:short-subunit dehydrogenase
MLKPVALITGASRGIGREVALFLAGQGYDLILLARDEALLDELAQTVRENHAVKVQTVSVDVTAFDEVRRHVHHQLAQFGRLDVLVNSAGIFRFGSSALANSDLAAMFATNVTAAHNLLGACSSALKAAGRAHVFNISSIAGVEGFAPIGGYCASKFALVGYGQSLAKELLGAGIRVTTLCPDVVDTDMSRASGMPADQMISPGDICRAIGFVLSLSGPAVVDRIVIQCRALVETSNART